MLLTTVHWITRSDRYGMFGQPYGVIVKKGVPIVESYIDSVWNYVKIQFANEIKHSFMHIKIQTHVAFETPPHAVDCMYCSSLT